MRSFEKRWKTEAGLDAIVKLNTAIGIRCGYVRVPDGHAFDGMEYEEVMMLSSIKVHGDLTFSSPADKSDNGGTWFGFDCGHYGDGYDFEAVLELCETEEERNQVKIMMRVFNTSCNERHKTLGFVINECELLAKQFMED